MNAGPWGGDPRPPRRWQAEALPIVMRSIRARERGVLQACTGAGKTRLTMAVLREVVSTLRPGWRVVVSAPRTSLVEQTAADARRALGAHAVGEWHGDRKQGDRAVVVVCHDSMPTLADYLTARGLRVALWVADEVHRASTDTVLGAVEQMQPWSRWGITATPFRSCETEALTGWERIVYSYEIDEAIAEGVLVPYRMVPWRGEEVGATSATVAMVLEHAPPGPGLVSATDVEDARVCAEAMTAAGVPALEVHSYQSDSERKSRIRRLLSGEVRCLVHVDLLTEGVDLPPLRWLAMRRPRGSAVGIVQEVGRVLRTMDAPDRWGHKAEAVVLLPHETPVLAALTRPAALALDPVARASALREAAERELEPAERVLPLAAYAPDLEAWLGRLVDRAVADGVAKRFEYEDPHVRRFAPTAEQVRVLQELAQPHKHPSRYAPEATRAALKAATRRPEALSRGAVSDLLSVLLGLRHRAGQHYRQSAHKAENERRWTGWRPVGMEPPADAAKAWERAK